MKLMLHACQHWAALQDRGCNSHNQLTAKHAFVTGLCRGVRRWPLLLCCTFRRAKLWLTGPMGMELKLLSLVTVLPSLCSTWLRALAITRAWYWREA